MQFNNSSAKEDSLYHYTLFLLGLKNTDTTSFPIADFTRSVNVASEKVAFLMWKYDSNWQFDDPNFATYPIPTTTLVDGQQDYSLPTTILDISRVEVMDNNGDYQLLTQFDKAQIKTSALSEYYGTAGMPVEYDILNGSIFLYPKPAAANVTLVKGLKIHLTRGLDLLTTTDTTQQPGFLRNFHDYVAYYSAFEYAIGNSLTFQRIQLIKLGLGESKEDIKVYYALRNKDLKVKIRPKTNTYT